MKNSLLLLNFFLLLFFSHSCFATNYIWKPSGGSRSFNSVGNWKLNTCNGTTASSLPGSGDTITFSNCSNNECHIDVNVTVKAIVMATTYTDTVYQDNGYTITLEQGSLRGGVFMGGNSAILCTKNILIDGTAFKATSGDFTIRGDFNYKTTAFHHNNGKVIFNSRASGTNPFVESTSTAVTVSFYKLEFGAPSYHTTFNLKNITIEVNNELKISGDSSVFLSSTTGGNIKAKGDIISSNTSTLGGGSSTIEINGTGSQALNDNSGTDATGKLCNVKVNKSSGTLSLQGYIALGGSTEWNYVSGTVSPGISTLLFFYNNIIKNNSGGAMNFYNLNIIGNGGADSIKGTITVTNNFVTSSSGNCIIHSTSGGSGVIELQGNVSWNNTATSTFGNVKFKFSGGSTQLFSGSIQPTFYNVEINKSGGYVLLADPLTISNNLNLTSKHIFSSDTSLLTLNNGVTVSNASVSSFVSGPVKKIGNSSFTFPLGRDTTYKPLTISAPSTSTDAFTATYFQRVQPHGFNKSGLTYISLCEYWNLTRNTGSSSVQISLSWDDASCSILTLSTLKIGRWSGSQWVDVGAITTSGNTVAGTIQTNSSQSSFGDFVIAKNSPVVNANAGNDITINIGQSTTLGGSPTASGGTSPYTYQWVSAYGLSSTTTANPTALPYRTIYYRLKVTDADDVTDIDTVKVTVTGFDLKTARRFAFLAGEDLTFSGGGTVQVIGDVGTDGILTGDVEAADSVLIQTSVVELAVRHLDTVIKTIDLFSASSISGNLSNQTYTKGVYRITGNATLSDTLILQGDYKSFFVFDIDRNFTISHPGAIILDGVTKEQVYFSVDSNITVTDSATLNGHMLSGRDISGGKVRGNFSIRAVRDINVNVNLAAVQYVWVPLKPIFSSHHRPIDNYFGYNAGDAWTNKGWDDPKFATHVPILKPDLLRYPGGGISNFFNWRTGWWRGYENPLYKDLIGNSGLPYGDEYPLPDYCHDGTPWDLHVNDPHSNYITDFKLITDACTAFPVFDLNLISSGSGAYAPQNPFTNDDEEFGIGSQLSYLFKSHCIGLPVRYVELGNEFYLSGPEDPNSRFPTPENYLFTADEWAADIKEVLPNAKVAAIASTSKGSDLRRNTWNCYIPPMMTNGDLDNIDAFTFHVYTDHIWDLCDFDAVDFLTSRDSLKRIFGNAFDIYDEKTTAGDCTDQFPANWLQPELYICDNDGNYIDGVYDKEAWITEYNQNDDKVNFGGRWAHSLFLAANTLYPLEFDCVTKVTCFTTLGDGHRGALFEDDDGLKHSFDACDIEDPPATEEWARAASGLGLSYIGEATKHAKSARLITFSGYSTYNDGEDGIYGWIFSDATEPRPDVVSGTNWSVILNLTDKDVEIYTDGFQFPFGQSDNYYRTMYPGKSVTGGEFDPVNGIYDPRIYVTGDFGIDDPFEEEDEYGINETIEQQLYGYSGETMILKAYSITIIGPSTGNKPSTIYAEATNGTTCPGTPTTIYVAGSYTNQYYIEPPDVNGNSHVPGPAISVSPSTTTLYKIYGSDLNGGLWNPVEVTINVEATSPNFTVQSSENSPVCANSSVTLTTNPTSDYYIWNPDDDLSDSGEDPDEPDYIGSSMIAKPRFTTTYTVTSTDLSCYCIEQTISVDVLTPPDAGDDIIICTSTDPTAGVTIGSQTTYPGATSVVWTEDTDIDAPGLSNTGITQPLLTGTLVEGDYIYTFDANYSGCDYDPDEMTVTVLSCCTDAGADVFDPYPNDGALGNSDNDGKYDESGSHYLTACDFANILGVSTTCLLEDEALISDKNDVYIINGIFDVNIRLTIEDCPNIKFGPEAEVIIQPNAQLKILGSTGLSAGCEEMWKGISIRENLNREIQGLYIEDLNNLSPIIEDAETAITATRDSRLYVSRTDFLNNHRHVEISDYHFGFDKIQKSTFNTTGLLAPWNGQPTTEAIYLNDVPFTGDGGSAKGATILGNTISNCSIGISADNSGPIISGYVNSNTIAEISDVDIGIFSTNAQDPQTFRDYLFTNCDIGIKIEYTNGEFTEVYSNDITTNGYASDIVGIYVDEHDAACDIQIGDADLGNTINVTGETGILVIGCEKDPDVLPKSKGAIIAHNKILMPTGSVANDIWGIYVDDGKGHTIEYNKINDATHGDYSLDCNPTSECSLDHKYAITILDAKSVDITCNRTNATNTGLQFLATANNKDLKATIRGNTFQWHNDGLAIGAPSGYGEQTTIGEQEMVTVGTEDYTPGNYWKGDGSSNFNFGIAATHTYGTDNEDALEQPYVFRINESTYLDGGYFPNVCTTTVINGAGTALSILPVIDTHFGCSFSEPQGKFDAETEIEDSKWCTVYPNPADEYLNVSFTPSNVEIADIFITDLFGHEIICETIHNETHVAIGVSKLSAGLYVLSVKSFSGKLFVEKIAIIR